MADDERDVIVPVADLVACVRLLSRQRPILESEGSGDFARHTARLPIGHYCAYSHTSPHVALAKLVALLASWQAIELRARAEGEP